MVQDRFLVSALAWTCLVVAALPAGAQVLTRGPYLQNVTDHGVVVRFELESPAHVEVHHGASTGYGSVVDGGTSSSFEVTIGGYGPGERVHYALFSGGSPFTTDHSFITIPPPRAPFRLLVLGDTRSNHADHAEVISAAVDERADVCVHTGDLVSSGEDEADWIQFFDIEQSLLADVPQFATIGNHEEASGHVDLFTQYLTLPRNSTSPEHYYSVDYGNVHFLVLDGHVNVDTEWVCITRIAWWETCFTQNQLDWLASDLAAARANPDIDHIFVFNHMGPYSSKDGRQGMKHMRDLMPLFLDSGVSFIVSGHDHYYERGYSVNGIPYIVTAGGGAPLYDIGAPCLAPHTVVHNESCLHYTLFDFDHLTVTMTVYRIDGTVLDTYTFITDPRPCTDASIDCGILPPDCSLGSWACVAGLCQLEGCDGEPVAEEWPESGTEPDAEPASEPLPEPSPDASDEDVITDTGPAPDAPDDVPDTGQGSPACGCRLVR